MSSTVGLTGLEIRDGTITDLQVSNAAAIQELKILFDAIAGHHHDGIDSRLVSGADPLERVFDSTFTGSVNGSNVTFTLPSTYVANTVVVYRNGLRQKRTTHFTEVGPNQVQFVTAPLTGSILIFDFVIA